MDFFKIWIMPPLVGAIIGYFTNWLAIKMLFRPLNPVYIWKIKLPFTPGILPRERRKLTDSIGETVSRELLTGDVFRSRLEEPALRVKIEQAVYVIVDDILKGDAAALVKSFAGAPAGRADTEAAEVAGAAEASFASMEPGSGAAGASAASDSGALVAASFQSILRSAEFRMALADAAGRAAGAAGEIPVGELLPPDRLREMAEGFAEKWGSGDKQAMIEAFLGKLAEPAQDSGPLVSPAATFPLVEVAARSLYASLLPVVERILATESVRSDLSGVGVGIVRKAIGRMGPLQRLIVSAANYEKTLTDSMPDTINDITGALLKLLKDPGTVEKVLEAVRNYVDTPRIPHKAFPIAGILPIPELKKAISLFFKGLGDEKTSFADSLERRYLSIAEKPLCELLPGLPETLAAGFADGLSRGRGSDAGAGNSGRAGPGAELLSGALSGFLRSYVERIEGRTIGELLSLGDAEKRRIALLISGAVAQALSTQADRLVEALDIRQMVVSKIDGLDMAGVERIVLKVVNKELNWITILGGILGGLIGIIQSLLSLI